MPRRNHVKRHRQFRRVEEGQSVSRALRGGVAKAPVEKMIVPRGRCFFRARPGSKGKLVFANEGEAKKALNQAREARKTQHTGHVEERYYQCAKKADGGCGGWHLTSRKEYVERGKA